MLKIDLLLLLTPLPFHRASNHTTVKQNAKVKKKK